MLLPVTGPSSSSLAHGLRVSWPLVTSFKAVLKCIHQSESCRCDSPQSDTLSVDHALLAWHVYPLWLICEVGMCQFHAFETEKWPKICTTLKVDVQRST